MFAELVVTQQGLRAEVGATRPRKPKREFLGWGGGGGMCGVKVVPGSSCFPSWGPAEVRRVIERELVSLGTLRAP